MTRKQRTKWILHFKRRIKCDVAELFYKDGAYSITPDNITEHAFCAYVFLQMLVDVNSKPHHYLYRIAIQELINEIRTKHKFK